MGIVDVAIGNQELPVKWESLPKFEYKKQDEDSGREADMTATWTSKGASLHPRNVFQYLIDPKKWSSSRNPPPQKWPRSFLWPNDVLKAMVYDVDREDANSFKKKPLGYRQCHGVGCKNPNAEYKNYICDCKKAVWEKVNDDAWVRREIELRWVNDVVQIGAFARKSHRPGSCVGEYFGEVVPQGIAESDTTYLFQLPLGDRSVAAMDALRVGSWTRFINHSCQPNAVCKAMRIGGSMRLVIVVGTSIKEGEEFTIDYGSAHWEHRMKDKRFCQCGKSCRYSSARATEAQE
ncbi:SET domain-containing protein [Corynespora cassiicola Philippines]|uniref:SET domain-containing protein n=1 Tax=Corynespora cassiicola Philippines TaxID=1448308 RepID=A0A2T2NMS1_CORCC|nr:SET domain-containing protein [Corynespora cassiicola Philippines]